ncbi:MAG: response regulator [Acidobacteriota bacterium]
MKSPLCVLYLEDEQNDVELVKETLAAEDIICDVVCVDNRVDFLAAIEQGRFDLILSDYSLPSFDGMSALTIVQEKCPHIPFIFVSGAIGEEVAIESLKRGATDYVLKHRLSRLAPSLRRALREAEEKVERKLAEAKIREQAALLDIVPDAIFVRDMEDHIIFWNKGAERLYGWARDEAIGKDVRELLYKDLPFPDEANKQLLEQGEWSGEISQITKYGKEIVVESYWTLMRDDEGRPRSKLIVNTDITEKKKLASQFLRAQRMESIGTLASGIAHDLNNAMTPIMMAVQLLRNRITDEDIQDIINVIAAGATRSAGMVQQVLSFARGVEGKRTVLQLGYLISEIRKILGQTLSKSIEIKTSLSKALWPVSGDATQLHQVLMNLCLNAHDAMPRGGKLMIEAENMLIDEHYASMDIEVKPGRFVLISITDNGEGIPAEIRDKIFEPFFTTKEIGRGTGLGLSTTLAIVKSHDGFINVYSEVGKGTQFKIYLPAVEIKDSREQCSEKDAELPMGHGELILVVDDEALIREITKVTLEAYGYKVMTACDGTEAIALYSKNLNSIKVVLMDVMMPYLDGTATARVLEKIDPDVKIISSSGLKKNGETVQPVSASVKAFLPKPYTADKLLETIAMVLESL